METHDGLCIEYQYLASVLVNLRSLYSGCWRKGEFRLNIPTVVVGVAVLALGVYNYIEHMRDAPPSEKLKAMRERFGDDYGNKVHIVAYSFLPGILGIIFLLVAYGGGSAFD